MTFGTAPISEFWQDTCLGAESGDSSLATIVLSVSVTLVTLTHRVYRWNTVTKTKDILGPRGDK